MSCLHNWLSSLNRLFSGDAITDRMKTHWGQKDWVPEPWSWGRTGYLYHGAGEGLGTCAMELGKDYPEPTTMERVSAVTKVTAKAG